MFNYNLKFLNVDATVYRHTLTSGKQPKIKVLRYSSSPLISIDTSRKEILVSTADSNCIVGPSSSTTRSGYTSRKLNALMTATAMALTFGHGSNSATSTLSACAVFLGTTFFFNQGISGSVFAEAAETSCTPSMQIVIEAPPYYLGSVAECLNEVENPDHCPDDFPSFPTCQNHNPTCELAVVGAGTGGLYAALRLVDEKKVDGRAVCVFEATERVGGRLYSLRGFGPSNKITVDAGGYRTWPQYTVSFIKGVHSFSHLTVICLYMSHYCIPCSRTFHFFTSLQLMH